MVEFDIFEHRNQKQLIFELLTTGHELTAKNIHHKLKKKYAIGFTYQSTFKALSQMVEKDILLKKGLQYELNTQWIKQQLKAFEKILKKEESNKSRVTYNSEGLKVVSCQSLKELDNLFQKEIIKLNKRLKQKATFWKTPHCWWLQGYPLEEKQVVASYEEQKLLGYALITRKTNLDIDAKRYYESEKFGRIKLIEKKEDNEVVQVIGDYVFICELPEKVLKELDKYYMLPKEKRELKKILKIISQKASFDLKVIKNKNFAKMYIQQIQGTQNHQSL